MARTITREVADRGPSVHVSYDSFHIPSDDMKSFKANLGSPDEYIKQVFVHGYG